MDVPVRIEPAAGAPVAVEYRWDPDTDILTANLCAKSVGEGLSGSVGVEGADGSWLILDVSSGRINGVEVAVWPDVHKRASLDPPADIENVRVTVPARTSQPGIAALEMDTSLTAEADGNEATIHFRLGSLRQTRTVRIAQDILLDIDQRERIAGLWLLNVPPFPLDS